MRGAKNVRYRHKYKRLTRLKNRAGYIFIAPFLIGFALFMMVPLAQSIYFSFNNITITPYGFTTEFIGTRYYVRAFTIDPNFRVNLVNSLIQVFTDLPIILGFSFFSAILLSKNFKGRVLARVLFFLPVIISTGIVVSIQDGNALFQMMAGRDVAGAGAMTPTPSVMAFVNSFLGNQMPEQVLNYITTAVYRLGGIITMSGIQIIIFLSGLNTISPSIYESSNIEGATAWENFCKITFPMMGPYLFLNALYTIIDSFTNLGNVVIASIRGLMLGFVEFSYASALAWIYFIIVFVILGLFVLIFGKRVFYYE